MINWYKYPPKTKLHPYVKRMRLKKHIKPINAEEKRKQEVTNG